MSPYSLVAAAVWCAAYLIGGTALVAWLDDDDDDGGKNAEAELDSDQGDNRIAGHDVKASTNVGHDHVHVHHHSHNEDVKASTNIGHSHDDGYDRNDRSGKDDAQDKARLCIAALAEIVEHCVKPAADLSPAATVPAAP